MLAKEPALRGVGDGDHALFDVFAGGLTGVDAGLDRNDEGACRPTLI